jgi:hypothetical protein
VNQIARGVAAFLIGFLLTAPVCAEEQGFLEKPWEKGFISFGGFVAGTDSNIRLGVEGAGVVIDLEEVLGLQTTTTVFRTDAMWRFTENLKHRADFTWFALKRTGSSTLTRDITIDGVTLPSGSQVVSRFDLDIFKLGYNYSIFQDNRMDIAAGIGLFIAPISFDLNASGLSTHATSESITAPLPVFTLRGDFAITPKLFLKNNIELFYLEYGDFKGKVFDYKLNLEYNWFEHFGVGAGVETFTFGLESQGNDYPGIDFIGQIGFSYAGLLLYGKLYF